MNTVDTGLGYYLVRMDLNVDGLMDLVWAQRRRFDNSIHIAWLKN